MSIESAKAFLERMKTDEDFRNSVGGIGTAEDRIVFVKSAGFDFTKEELENVQEKMQLTAEELGRLSGGEAGCVGLCDTTTYYTP